VFAECFPGNGREDRPRADNQAAFASELYQRPYELTALAYSRSLMPTALSFDLFGVISACDGLNGFDVVGEEVPDIAASADDFLAGFEDGDGELVGTQAGPDILDRI